MMRKLTHCERTRIMDKSGIYLPYTTFLDDDNFTLWAKSAKTYGMDRIVVEHKIIFDIVR